MRELIQSGDDLFTFVQVKVNAQITKCTTGISSFVMHYFTMS